MSNKQYSIRDDIIIGQAYNLAFEYVTAKHPSADMIQLIGTISNLAALIAVDIGQLKEKGVDGVVGQAKIIYNGHLDEA